MESIEDLYKEAERLKEILEVLILEGTQNRYVVPFEKQLEQVNDAIKTANVSPK